MSHFNHAGVVSPENGEMAKLERETSNSQTSMQNEANEIPVNL